MDWLDWDEPRPERSRTIGLFCSALAAWKWALIGAPIAALFTVGLFLLLTPPQYLGAAQILIGRPTDSAGADYDIGIGETRLIASRDLARRAIQDLGIEARPEFDPLAANAPGLISRTLILAGLMRDPARLSAEERILDSYEDRLTVSASPKTGLLSVAFRSKDRDFAANAANRIADLYLEARASADARTPDDGAARLVARATPPLRPMPPDRTLLLAIGGGAAFAAMLGAFVLSAALGARASPPIEEPVAPPHALGQTEAFVRLKETARPRSERGGRAALNQAEADNAQALAEIARRILSARRAGDGVRIVGARLVAADAAAQGASNVMLALGRLLAREGRSIVVSLDAANAEALPVSGEQGLSDLLSGSASFDEVIRRDPESRLHFVPAGAAAPIDLGELAHIIDALARTYDFIWLLAPSFDANDMAKTLAADADFVVLAAPPPPHESLIRKAEAELRECGAGEILIIGAPILFRPSLGQDAA